MRKASVTIVLWTAALYGQDSGVVTGKIIGDRGQPLSASITVVTGSPGVRMRSVMTSDQGSFTIETPPGPTSFLARADGYTSEQAELMVRPGQANPRLNIALSPAASISGRVVDPAGRGVAGSRVWVQYRGNERSWRFADEAGGEAADPFGSFTIPVVAQGRPFVLLAESEGWLLSSSQIMTVRSSELTGVLLLLSRRGTTVTGRVLDTSGRPVAGATVHLRAIPAETEFSGEQRASIAFARGVNRMATSRGDGSYSFEGVPAGRVVVRAQAQNQRAALEADTVSGRQAILDLVLR